MITHRLEFLIIEMYAFRKDYNYLNGLDDIHGVVTIKSLWITIELRYRYLR